MRFVSAAAIASVHILPHVGMPPPASFDLFVDLFFVVSGIVIGSVYAGRIRTIADWRLFMRKRFARIYPLHLATLLFYVAMGFAVARYRLPVDDPARFDPREIPGNLLLVQAWFPWGRLSYNFVSWSISAELFVYLLFPLITAVVTGGRTAGLIVVALLLAAAGLLAERGLGMPLHALRWNSGILRALPSFAFGVWLSAYAARLAPALRGHVAAIFHLVLLAFVISLFAMPPGAGLLLLIYALVATGYIADLERQPTMLAWRPVSALGKYTYSIYMLHVPVVTVFLSFLLPRLLGDTNAAQAVSVALACIVLAGTAAASFHLFENPLRKLLGGRVAARG